MGQHSAADQAQVDVLYFSTPPEPLADPGAPPRSVPSAGVMRQWLAGVNKDQAAA